MIDIYQVNRCNSIVWNFRFLSSLELESNNLAAAGRDEASPLPRLRTVQGEHVSSGSMEVDGKAQEVVPLLARLLLLVRKCLENIFYMVEK